MVQQMNPILIKGIQIYTEGTVIKNGFIKINAGKIVEIGLSENLKNEDEFEIYELPSHYKAIPGLIDIHIHGVNGADVMDASKEALDTIVTALPREGTTSFLATTMTHEGNQIEKALINAGEYIKAQEPIGRAEILGIHLEGPFVNIKKAGAQPIQHIINPDLVLFQGWKKLTNGNIKVVTLAPELPGGLDMIRYLKANGIIASIGHTDATYEEVMDAIDAGANHVTHLFNQMKGLHHREPGVLGAAFLRDELIAEIIVDGVHVRSEVVKLAFKQKKCDGLILITDSMRAKCLENGKYDLGGQEVTVKNGKAVLEDGTLAGSILKMGHAVKNIMAFTGCSLEDAIKMASGNPAKKLNLYHRKGSLAVGKDADLVILDEELEVHMTLCNGALAFKREES